MKKILYLDCFSGISGDMLLGTLIDLGVDAKQLEQELNKLQVSGWGLTAERRSSYGITGINVTVVLPAKEHEQEHIHQDEHVHAELHAHADTDIQRHKLYHHHKEQPKQEQQHEHCEHRYLPDIIKIIEDSSISQAAKTTALAVFREIAQAEAKVHGKTPEEVHFHEVGALDSIVDIIGTAIALDMLRVDAVYVSPLADGYGTIKCQHGEIPVPVPAVMAMVAGSGFQICSRDIPTELITPTGMGIAKTIAEKCCRMPVMQVEKVGYGFGKRETGSLNALRGIIGLVEEDSSIAGGKSCQQDNIICLETNIDDMPAEILAYAMECLLEGGARDVFITPIQMKKNRPAWLLTVLTEAEKESDILAIIFRETTTLGIRRTEMERYCLKREISGIDTEFGQVHIKTAWYDGQAKVAPEYEDCRRIARESGLPLREIYAAVMNKVRETK